MKRVIEGVISLPTAMFPEGKLVTVKVAGCLLVLSEGELRDLLKAQPALWTQAVRRGKAVLRRERAKARLRKAGEDDGPSVLGRGGS